MGDLETIDVMALQPEELLEEEVDGLNGDDGDEDSTFSDAVGDFKVNGRGALSGALLTRGGDLAAPSVNFPDRPLVRPPPLGGSSPWLLGAATACLLPPSLP